MDVEKEEILFSIMHVRERNGRENEREREREM